MKLTVKRLTLLQALDRIRWTASGQGPQELLKCFCFRDGLVTAYNGQAGTVTACDLGGMEFAVHADRFYRLIYSLFEDIELELIEGRLNVKSGPNKTWIGVLDVRTYPEIFPGNASQLSDSKNLVDALNKVYFTVGHNVLKPQLMGCFFHGGYVYTSDSYRVSRAALDTPVTQDCTIPALAMGHIIRLGSPKYCFAGDNLMGCFYENPKTTYISRSLENRFPWQTVDAMYASPPEQPVDLPDVLAAALNRIRIATPDSEPDIILECDGSALTVRTYGYLESVGGGRETMDFPCGSKFKVAVKPEYILAAMQKTKTVDLTGLLAEEARFLRFYGPGFDHSCGLLTLKEGE